MNPERLCSALDRAGLGSLAPAVRAGLAFACPVLVQADEGRYLHVRLGTRAEGFDGVLVAEMSAPSGERVIVATERGATREYAGDDARTRVRSVRISDGLWRELERFGEPSAVLRDIASDWLSARLGPLERP